MRTIIQISDIHFGKVHTLSMNALVAAFQKIDPDLVIISGDLTQRARRKEYKRAATFLSKIKKAGYSCLVIPGNHDIAPIYKPLRRIFDPYFQYKKYISENLQPTYADDEIAIASINTVRPSRLTNGAVNITEIRRVESWFSTFKKDVMRVVVTHHPLDLPIERKNRKLAHRAETGIKRLSKHRVDIYLSGHYHRSSVVHTAIRHNIDGYSAVAIQAGTLSRRQRGEVESFNVLYLDRPILEIETYLWKPANKKFERYFEAKYRHDNDMWSVSF